MSNVLFREKAVAETQTLVFDFASILAPGESISSASTSAAVYSGVDGSPAAIISGGSSISGTKISQKVTGGVAGVVYKLTCLAATTGGNTVELSGFLGIS